MKVAELCDTAPSYIGEIEIGRRFPSLKLIEKIGEALHVEPYRFFIDDTEEHQGELDEIVNLLTKLPEQQRLNIINRISASWRSISSLQEFLKPFSFLIYRFFGDRINISRDAFLLPINPFSNCYYQ